MSRHAEVKELLWSTVYSKLIRKDWFDLLYNTLSNPGMKNVFTFLHGLNSSLIEGKVTPEFKNIFAPYDIFTPTQTKVVIVGDYPNLYLAENNNGLAYSFKATSSNGWRRKEEKSLYAAIESCEFQNLCGDLYEKKYEYFNKFKEEIRNLKREIDELSVADSRYQDEYFKLVAEAEAELEELDVEWYSEKGNKDFPFNNIANQGVLMMYLTPTVSVGSSINSQKHRNAWKGFTEGVLTTLSERLSDLVFLTFENRPKEIVANLVDPKKHLILDCKSADNLQDFYITSRINEFIAATQGYKKVIDFRLMLKNENILKF